MNLPLSREDLDKMIEEVICMEDDFLKHDKQNLINQSRLAIELKEALEHLSDNGLGIYKSGDVYHITVNSRSIVTIHRGGTALSAIQSAMKKEECK